MTQPSFGRRLGRSVWAAALSLVFPGLGQIYAGLWRGGAILLCVGVALSLALRAITLLLPPTGGAIGVAAGVMLIELALGVGSAAIAVRHLWRLSVRPVMPWRQSTWLAGGVVVAIGIASSWWDFGWRAFSISSGSDLPTLRPCDQVLADARGQAPTHGDMIVFTVPGPTETNYIKRVIALPGERVALRAGRVVIDGATLERVEDGMFTAPGQRRAQPQYRETMPNGTRHRILVASDLEPGETMAERRVPAGHVFVLGDNRDNSLDSRYPAIGFVAIPDVVGIARTIHWSCDRARILRPLDAEG